MSLAGRAGSVETSRTRTCLIGGKRFFINRKSIFRTSMTLQNLNYPMTFGSNVIGDYVKDFIGVS
jgi:hypothetical protein